MIRRIIICLLGLCLLAGCQEREKGVWEGPFGLKEGLLFADYNKGYNTTDNKSGQMLFETYEVPKPDKRFMHYQLAFDPDAGLCKIVAHGKTANVSPDGHQLRALFDKMVADLEKQYGPMTDSFDFVQTKSQLSAPEQWMQSLLARERILGGYWESGSRIRGGNGAILKLPDQLVKVVVAARAFTEKTGAIKVEYEFTNYPQCVTSARLRGLKSPETMNK